MSKSTRFTKEDLGKLGLEEVSPGVFAPVKKKTLKDLYDEVASKELPKGVMPPEDFNEQVFGFVKNKEFQDRTKGSFQRLEDGKIEFTPDEEGRWEIVNRPNDAEPLYYMGADPVSDEPSHSAVVKRSLNGDVEYMSEIPNYKLRESLEKIRYQWQDDIEKGKIQFTELARTKGIAATYIFLMVKGDPTPQQRHRHHQVKGADFVSTYDPSAKAKKAFLKQCLPYKPKQPYERPLRVDMVFYFSRPKSHYRSGKYAHILKDSAPEYHTSRGDLDNLCKMPMDSLNKIFWKDDAYIVELSAVKKYDDNPRTEITITPL